MLLFMEKPSKKLYPEYYNIIDRPIDMLTIEANIKVCYFFFLYIIIYLFSVAYVY